MENPINPWMIWGEKPHFRKHLFVDDFLFQIPVMMKANTLRDELKKKAARMMIVYLPKW